MLELYQRNKAQINKVLLYLGFILAVYVFVVYLYNYVAPFFIAFVISLVVEPIVSFFNKRFKIHRGFLALLCVVFIIALTAVLGTNIVSRVINEAQQFAKNIPNYINEASTTIKNIQVSSVELFEFIPDEYKISFDDLIKPLVQSVTSSAGHIISSSSQSVVSVVPKTIMFILLCAISTFFFIKDKPLITDLLVKVSPAFLLNGYNVSKKGLFKALGGYIRAQLIIMSVIATIVVTGLILIGFPYALFVGLLIALVDALPIFGSGFILWPWAAFQLITGDFKQAIGLMVIYGIVLVTRQSLEPKVLGNQIGVHPLLTLMSIYIGLQVFGVLGFFIGPVIVVTIKTLNESKNV